MRVKVIFWTGIGALCLYIAVFVYKPARHHPAGQIAPLPPLQNNREHGTTFEFKGYTFQPLAQFAIQARVLSTKTYWFDGGSKICPIDLALGWGPMSDSSVVAKLDISQNGRWYEYYWSNNPPIDPSIIATHSANMHMIPSTPEIRKKLLLIHRGDIIEIIGCLVQISGPDGYKWRSSTSRTDTDGGACEVVYVESLEINPKHD